MPLTEHDVLLGGDVDPKTGRMRSLAALLQALREAEVRVITSAAPMTKPRTAPAVAARHPDVMTAFQQPAVLPLTRPVGGYPGRGLELGSDTTVPRPPADVSWLAVIGAHRGAGASTVAVAVADAAAAAGRPVHLVSCATPSQCGLRAVPDVELGVDDSGAWRRGRRGNHLIVDRSSDEHRDTARWPGPPWPPEFTVVDACDSDWLTAACPSRLPVAVLLVCRATVPGVQQADRVLSTLAASRVPVLVAMIGPRRIPGSVHSATGPLLRELRTADRVVAVPLDRRLALTGPLSSPLPRPVAAAGRSLLRHLDAFRPQDRWALAQSAPVGLLTKERTS